MDLLNSKRLFNLGLGAVARLSRWDRSGALVLPIVRFLGSTTGRIRKLERKDNIRDLANEWQRMFPAGKQHMPIIEVTDDTAIAEIRLRCPLRDSGDVHACYRMMEYDRAMVGAMGGRFVVLDSQSDNGKGVCRVALRMKDKDVSDLTPAHVHRQRSSV